MKKYILLFFSLVVAFFIIVVPIIHCTQSTPSFKPLTLKHSATPIFKSLDSLSNKHVVHQ